MIGVERGELDRRARAGLLRARRKLSVKVCLVPGCSTGAPIINAHSIQQSNVLGRIAEGGHIYTFRPQSEGNGLVRLGVGKATTFTGFCACHDNELFKPVDFDDKTHVDINDVEQIIRLSLRAMACEYWKKLCSKRVYQLLHDLSVAKKEEELCELLNLDRSDVKGYMDFYSRYARASLSGTNDSIRRMRRIVKSLLDQLETAKYHLSKTAAFELPGPPSIAASAGFPIEWDLHGNRIATKKKMEDTPEVALNVLPSKNGSVALFLWHRRFDKRLATFFNELGSIEEGRLRTVLGQLVIMRCENVAISPRVVDNWTEEERVSVEKLFLKTLSNGLPFDEAPKVRLFVD